MIPAEIDCTLNVEEVYRLGLLLIDDIRQSYLQMKDDKDIGWEIDDDINLFRKTIRLVAVLAAGREMVVKNIEPKDAKK